MALCAHSIIRERENHFYFSMHIIANVSNRSDVFLPYGPDHGDSTLRKSDDGSSEEIGLQTNALIFGSSHNRLYVSHYDVIMHVQTSYLLS